MEELKKGCGGFRIITGEICGEIFKRNIVLKYFCDKCESIISASKERWKEEIEFLEFVVDESDENVEVEIIERIAELKEVLK